MKAPVQRRQASVARKQSLPSTTPLADAPQPIPPSRISPAPDAAVSARASIIQRVRAVSNGAPAITERSQSRTDIFFREGAGKFATNQGEAADARKQTPAIQQRASPALLDGVVQRLAVNDAPYPDVQPTNSLSMHKSGTGAGGVYFAEQGAQRIVIKLDTPEQAFRAQVGNDFISIGTGLRTPQSRIIAPGQPGNAEIKAAILAHSRTDQPGSAVQRPVNARLKTDAPIDTADPTTAVVIMENVPQTSLREMAQDPRQYDNLVRVLTDGNVVRGFAKLMVADAVLGNVDRFMKGLNWQNPIIDDFANISNIFVSADFRSAVALDNDAWNSEKLTEAQRARLEQEFIPRKLAGVRALLQRTLAVDVAEAVVSACLVDAGEIQAPRGAIPRNYHINYDPSPNARGPLHLKMLVNDVRDNMAQILAAAIPVVVKEVADTMRAQKNALRASHEQAAEAATGGTGRFAAGQSAEKVVDYNLLRARGKFLKIAAEGKGEAQAIREAISQLKHKEGKDARNEKLEKVGSSVKGFFKF